MKKTSLLLACFLCLLPLAISAKDGDIFVEKNKEGIKITYMVVSEADKTCQIGVVIESDLLFGDPSENIRIPAVPENTSGTVTIPSYVRGYKVTGIASNAFSNCHNLISINLPPTISSIHDYYAFKGCSDVISLTIPSNLCRDELLIDFLPRVHEITFCDKNVYPALWGRGRSRVTSIRFTDNVDSISHFAFANYKELTKLHISKNIKKIGQGIVGGCDYLEHISVDSDNPYYDSRNNCMAIIEKNTSTLIAGCPKTKIPNDVRVIQRFAFSSLQNLQELRIPSSVKEIKKWAFYECNSLGTIVVESENPVYDSRNNCNGIIETSSNKLILKGLKTKIPEGVSE